MEDVWPTELKTPLEDLNRKLKDFAALTAMELPVTVLPTTTNPPVPDTVNVRAELPGVVVYMRLPNDATPPDTLAVLPERDPEDADAATVRPPVAVSSTLQNVRMRTVTVGERA